MYGQTDGRDVKAQKNASASARWRTVGKKNESGREREQKKRHPAGYATAKRQ